MDFVADGINPRQKSVFVATDVKIRNTKQASVEKYLFTLAEGFLLVIAKKL